MELAEFSPENDRKVSDKTVGGGGKKLDEIGTQRRVGKIFKKERKHVDCFMQSVFPTLMAMTNDYEEWDTLLCLGELSI